MTSRLNADTISGKSTYGSISVVAEGNTVTTNLQQGLAKVWTNFDGGATNAASNDSFNIGGEPDNGTGSYTKSFTNNMGNANWTSQCSLNNGTTDVSAAHDYGWAIVDRTTSNFRWDTENASNSQVDLALLDAVIHGDLA